MVTDRPSFRNSARLIAPGVVQLETGWHLHDDRAPAESNLFGAEPALRLGTTAWLELRLRIQECILRSRRVVANEDPPAGCADLEPGVKLRLLQAKSGTSLAAILKMVAPTGHHSQTGGGYEPGFEMIWEQEAPLGFSAGGTVNASRLHHDDEIVWQKAASVSMSHQISGKFESFGEIM